MIRVLKLTIVLLLLSETVLAFDRPASKTFSELYDECMQQAFDVGYDYPTAKYRPVYATLKEACADKYKARPMPWPTRQDRIDELEDRIRRLEQEKP